MFSSLKLPKNLRLRSKQQQNQQALTQNQLEGGPPHLDLTSVASTKPGVQTSTVVTTNRRSHKWSIDKALCPGFVDRNGNDQKMLTTIDQNDCSLITNLANYGEQESHVYPSDNWSQSNYGQEDVSVTCKLTHVCIERDISGSLGITLRGGVQSNPENNMPLVITQVRPNGPADREGTIKVGDRLISVDGRPLHSVTLAEAQTILKDSGGPVSTLTVEYNVSNMDHLRSSHGTLLVEVNTTRPHSLGLTLVSTRHNSLVIGHVKVGSIAERCGAFMPGDQILAVNGTRVEGSDMTASDVYNLLWHPKDSVLLIEVLTAPTFNLRGYGKNKWYTTSTPTLSSPGSSATRQGPIYVNHCKLPSHDTGIGGIVHCENMLVSLHANQEGSFGVMLQWSETQQSTVVACIESNGPAERCGCLRVGDRVVKVNDCPPPICAEPRRLEQLLHGSSAILSVQFDIAQSVVPATGIFTVKLANNKNCGLGITMTSCNHGMVISQIRAGSVAHRSGTLFPGDRILAVNSCSLELLSLDEAVDLLQSAPDIVTLTIQKEVQAEPSVVYTVELERNGGPLGITIAGSEDCCEPIVISALTPSGLAEKTGALHVGDRLLAIDGQSIEKQPLSQAIALLQHSGDNVVLKVARSSQRMGPGYSSPGLPSVDSAVESWDSSQSPSTNQNCPSFYKQDETLRDPPKPVWEKMEPSQQTHNSMDLHSETEDCTSSYRLSESVISELQAQLNNNNNNNQKNNVQLPSPPCPLQVNYQHRNNTLPAHRRRSSTMGMQGSVELMNIDHSQKSFHATDADVCTSSKAMPEITFDTFLNRGKCQRASDIESSVRGNDVFQVTLFKDPVYEDYGFSVSDGLYERGVFINRIRHGGPADNSRMLCPYDRILQVNETRTDDFDCCLTVPLVAAAGDRLTLVVSRPSADSKDNSEGLPWVEEELEDSLNGSEIRSPTITKTL